MSNNALGCSPQWLANTDYIPGHYYSLVLPNFTYLFSSTKFTWL